MSYQLELRHIRYFLAVAKDLHFRKAAEKLFISQPGLSRQIKQLEEDTKLQLFDRHNRKVTLTPTGEYLNTELTKVIHNLDAIFSQAKLIEQGIEGELKMGYVGSAIHSAIPKLLIKIRDKFPSIIFDLKEMDNQKQIEAISKQEIDFGFVRYDRLPKNINKKAIYEDTFSIVLPASHPMTQRKFRDLSQLKDERFILFDASYSESYYEKVMQIFEDSDCSPTISHKTVHANTIYSLVENNFGVSIVPTSLKHGYDRAIKFIELKKIAQRTNLQVIWNKENLSPMVKNIVDIVKLNQT